MKLPTWQPRDRQMSERRHYDPPALWYAVILGSVVIHLSAFGILRLLMIGGLIGTPSATKLIPIDVIAIASSKPKTTSTTKLPPKTVAKPTPKPPTKSNQTQNRKPTSSASSSTGTKTQPGATKQPAANKKNLPVSNSSKPSGKIQPKTKPNTPTGTNKQPVAGTNKQPGTTTPNSPSPSPTNSPTNKPTPNSQSGGGFIATFDNLAPISLKTDIPNPDNDNEKLATLLDDKKQLSAEDLKQLGISLNQDLKLKVGVVVETDGTATVWEDEQVVVEFGSISQEKAVDLAKKIIPKLRFTPTLGNGKPRRGNYNLQLKISPAPK